jgi:hypothetical protein
MERADSATPGAKRDSAEMKFEGHAEKQREKHRRAAIDIRDEGRRHPDGDADEDAGRIADEPVAHPLARGARRKCLFRHALLLRRFLAPGASLKLPADNCNRRRVALLRRAGRAAKAGFPFKDAR